MCSVDYVSIIGSVAGTLTTVAFVPQVIQVVKTKSTRDISLGMFIAFTLGVVCWLIYGVLMHAAPIIIANAVVVVFAAIILGYKLKYK